MNKNKWFLNGGRGSGKSIRLLCETYENKIVELQNKVDTLQGFLDHDIEYDMDKTIQEQKIKIAELENENKVLAQNLEDTEIINAELKKKVENLQKYLDTRNCYRECAETWLKLTEAKKLLKQFLEAKNGEDTYKAEWEAEQFLKETK